MTEILQTEATRLTMEEREHAVITESRFFDIYRDDLRELFSVLDRQEQWSEDPREMLGYIRRGWIGAEHGNSTSKDQFTPEQVEKAQPILDRMGLLSETLPLANAHFDDAIVVGGTTQANYRREGVVHKAIAERGVTTDRITLWMGQRPREARDGTDAELLSATGRFAGNDITSNPWVRKELASKTWEATDPWEAQFADETAVGRVAMLKLVKDGADMQPHRIDLGVTDLRDPHQAIPAKQPDVPARLITDYRFTAPDGQEIVIMNAAAVSRGEGRPSRHTTASCTKEWLERHVPAPNARVLFVSSNPHTLRTAQDTYRILKQAGRGDIELVVAGASAPANASIQLLLGEVGRLIDNDVTRNYDATVV